MSSALLDLPGHASFLGRETSIPDWLEAGARRFGDRPALAGLSGPTFSHTDVWQMVSAFAEILLDAGIGRGDVVAVALPNGPRALVATLAVASVAVALPLDPNEPAPSAQAVLRRLPVRLLLVEYGHRTGLIAAASGQGIPVAMLRTTNHGASLLTLVEPLRRSARANPTRPADACVIAATAGTTRDAKLVAWSQISLAVSFQAAAGWMGLRATDRSLCVMPFAHLHSLVRSCAPVLFKGGAVICAPGFDPVRLPSWIDATEPTFMTAAPAVFRGLLTRITETGWRPLKPTLRFLASGSDAMDAITVQSLVAELGIPVREFYGMSEVSPMLAGSARDRLARERGEIGRPVPPWRLAVLGDDGQLLPPETEGEIMARGGLVNPVVDGTGAAVVQRRNGWYATGDRGWIDIDGRLFVSGCVDDRLNRGGQKIAPEAIEAIIRQHPDVREAVVFPIAEAVMGERVGVVVTPETGCAPDPAGLRAFVAEQLADHMVPERWVIRDNVPLTVAGKIARRTLAQRLGIEWADGATVGTGRTTPATQAERGVAAIVVALLERDTVDLDADFEAIGLTSFHALSLMMDVEEQIGVQLSPAEYLANASIAALAQVIERKQLADNPRGVVQLKPGASQPVLFVAHGVNGSTAYFTSALRHVHPDLAVYGLQWDRLDTDQGPARFEDHAAGFLPAIRAVQPHGPYCLAGHSLAGHLAFVIAQLLEREGETVAFVAVLDDEADQFQRQLGIRRSAPEGTTTRQILTHLLRSYVPEAYGGDVWLYRAAMGNEWGLADPGLGWAELTCGTLRITEVPGDHDSMMGAGSTATWMDSFQADLHAAWKAANSSAAAASERKRRATALRARPDVAMATAARIAAKDGDQLIELARYRDAIATDPAQPYWVYRHLGAVLTEMGDLEGAVEAYYEAAQREHIPIVGLGLLGQAFLRVGKHAEAEDSFKAAEAFAADSAAAQCALADIDVIRGRLETAETRIRRVADTSEAGWVLWRLSRVLAARSHFDDAINVMRRAQTLEPFAAEIEREIAALVVQRDRGRS